MMCLNCCARPSESMNKLRYVSDPLTHSLLEMPLHKVAGATNTPRPLGYKLPCAIVPFVMTEFHSEWGQNGRPAEKWSAPVYIKICWRPTWDLHYVHFAALGLSPALVNTTLWYCPALVLTLCWQRHKWELTLGTETGIFHFTYPHREMCWGCGNVYIRQSDIFFSHWSCNGNWRKKGNCLLKCISP